MTTNLCLKVPQCPYWWTIRCNT